MLAVRNEVIVMEQSPDDEQADEEAAAWDENKRLVWQEACNRIDECAKWLNSQPELDNLLTEEGENCLRRTIAALQDWLRFF